jgi:ATP-dependent DNA helicase RecQ
MCDATLSKHHLTDLIYIMRYEQKTKNIESDIIRFIKQHQGKSEIIA